MLGTIVRFLREKIQPLWILTSNLVNFRFNAIGSPVNVSLEGILKY